MTPSRVDLVVLEREALQDLAVGDLAAAGTRTGLVFPEFFLGEAWLWRLHEERMLLHPQSVGWLARAAVLRATREVIGHGGFHFQPDQNGMVEIGYTVLPEFRGRGLATAIAGELLRFAAADPRVAVVRASISPSNEASLAIIRHWGFVHVGEQTGDDGLELVFERTNNKADL